MNKYIINNLLDNYLLPTVKHSVFLLLLMPIPSHSKESVLAVMSNHGTIQENFYFRLKNKLTKNISITKINYSDITKEIISRHSLVISIGSKSASVIAKLKNKKTVIYTLIPYSESLRSRVPCKTTNCYKVYINQPISRYVELFKLLFPNGKNLVLATTSKSSIKSQQIKSISTNYDINFKKILINKQSNIVHTFLNNLSKNDVLLALPNSDIYNANNARSILLSTYHANVPIIAYSKSFVKAGALVSLYSSINDIAETTATIINKAIKNRPFKKKEFYPDNYTVEINYAVARSLNINIDSENAIKRKLK